MIVFWILVVVILLFGFVVAYGAPYLPTLHTQTDEALELLDLKPGQVLLELGSGDGRVARRAAQRGLYVIGYELNPLLVITSLVITRKYRRQVRIKWRNYWREDWPKTDGIYTFLLDKYMEKLDKKIIQTYKTQRVKLVSFAFSIPNKNPIKTVKGLYLYRYND